MRFPVQRIVFLTTLWIFPQTVFGFSYRSTSFPSSQQRQNNCCLLRALGDTNQRSSTARFQSSSSRSSSTSSSSISSSTSTQPIENNRKDDADLQQESIAATLRSVTICNVPKREEPELLCDFLMEIGACATAIIDADRGTDLEQPLFCEPGTLSSSSATDPWTDSVQWAAPIWNRCNVTAHFPSSVDLAGVVDLIADVFPEQYPSLEEYRIEQVPNKDWVIHVQQSWNPITIGPYILRFPWHTKNDIEKAVENDNEYVDGNRVELSLQGGIAFGTGEHPTTQLCLEWIHREVNKLLQLSEDESITVLDYGAGSGVLGMAACALDRDKVKAVGIDIDVDAIQIANANAKTNDVSMRNYLPPLVSEKTADDESLSLLMKAHAHAKKQLEDRQESG